MKRSRAYILGSLLIATFVLSACGSKGGGSPAAATPGATDTPTGTPTQVGRGWWKGYLQIVNRDLLKSALRDSRVCDECRFQGAFLMVRILDGQLPGRGRFDLQTYRNGQWKARLNKNVGAVATANGFQMNYNVLSSDWPGSQCSGGQSQPQQQNSWYVGVNLNRDGWYLGGSVQNGQESSDCIPAQGPQVLQPEQTAAIAPESNLQITSEFGNAERTLVRVSVTYHGQVVAVGDLTGHLF